MTEAPVTESAVPEAEQPGATPADNSAEPALSNTPGAVLHRAREERGQSISDVVQVIRFSARQIEALERDDYAALPGPTAVRGLVRNYAKFLKLDPTPLLAQLDPAVPIPESDVRPPANMGEAEDSTLVEKSSASLPAIVAVLVLLALGAYWFLVMSGSDEPPGTSAVSGIVAPATNPPTSPPVAPVVVPTPPTTVEGAPVVAPPAGGLRVEFDDRSWVEIRDATQKIVFVGEYPAGTRQDVDGKAPFQIWIGKASGVRLFMGERSIDLKPHTREEVARFTLE
ncbi:helix-turn-helix domain-containing protein [Sulfuritalea sp.]|uniref:helix-turn-helix domain-containing protein n=1 Tax=Sulfuritalea sp. TaxID=2480090 RepID=UPI001AD00991|nr:helix-turn-helix domain-containing protein [Sulfuritalea sp.]MBN8476238.1 DUF4115 domain-containing protein [Sulfuritalea sp.]